MPSAKAYPIVTSRSGSYICAHNPSLSSYRRWTLVLCTTCGSRGTHRECSSLRSNQKKWECEECAPSPKVTGGTEGWSGLRTGVGWGWGDLWCLRKEEGMPPDGDSMVPLVWEGKWLWKGLRTCTWGREGWVFLSHLSFTTDYISENSGDNPCCSTFYSGGAWLQRHQPGREFGPFLDWLARTFFIRETRILWWQEGPLLAVQGCQNH